MAYLSQSNAIFRYYYNNIIYKQYNKTLDKREIGKIITLNRMEIILKKYNFISRDNKQQAINKSLRSPSNK